MSVTHTEASSWVPCSEIDATLNCFFLSFASKVLHGHPWGWEFP